MMTSRSLSCILTVSSKCSFTYAWHILFFHALLYLYSHWTSSATFLTIQFFLLSPSGVPKLRHDIWIFKDFSIILKLGYSLIASFFSSPIEKVYRTSLKSCPCRSHWWLFLILKIVYGNVPYASWPLTRFQFYKRAFLPSPWQLIFLDWTFLFSFLFLSTGYPLSMCSLTYL